MNIKYTFSNQPKFHTLISSEEEKKKWSQFTETMLSQMFLKLIWINVDDKQMQFIESVLFCDNYSME